MPTINKNLFIILVTIFVVIITYNEQHFPNIFNIAYLIWNLTALTMYCYAIFKHQSTNISLKMLSAITFLVYFPDFSFSHYIILMNFGLFMLLSFGNWSNYK